MFPIIPFLITVILTFFSTGVMSYIAMATPIGPWIAPTVVLIALLIFKVIGFKKNNGTWLALITASASLGGIIATACGFSFPTLFFCDQSLFSHWMESPLYFSVILGGLVFTAGAFGIWVANCIEYKLVVQEQLDFPIGQLIYKIIAVSQNLRKAYELIIGFFSTLIFSVLQDGFKTFAGIIPTSLTVSNGFSGSLISIPLIRFDLWPLLWAVGFVAGPLIAVPLLVGSFSKFVLLDPINTLFFAHIKNVEFVLAFCSGMVVSSAISGFLVSPKKLYEMFQKLFHTLFSRSTKTKFTSGVSRAVIVEGLIVCAAAIIFLTLFQVPFLAQGYLLLTTWICTYQMAVIAGKIGLAQLGRWATFVMVPALFLFDLSCVHIVFIATFVEISGGVACDVLFGRKLGHLSEIQPRKMRAAQYFGLLLTTLCIGAVFWLLISHFKLGSEHLFAARAQSRTLLLAAQTFDLMVLLVGVVFGIVLKFLHLNPMLVLGGLLMPLNLTIGLVFGGLLNYLATNKDEYIPFCSGVFAAGSIWMLLRTLI